MKKLLILIAALVLTACGTDGPSSSDPKPVVVEAILNEGQPYTNLDLSRDIPDCEWEVSLHTAEVTDETFAAGGHTLPHHHKSKGGSVYIQEVGLVTRWVEVSEGAMKIGLQCYNPADFK